MQRYFIEGNHLKAGSLIQLSADDAHHLFHVMRAKPGDGVEVVSQDEQLYLARVQEDSDSKHPVLMIDHVLADQKCELSVSVTLAVGISKNNRLDWLVQKATELGASTIIPLQMERNVVRWPAQKMGAKIERLEKIVIGAAQQAKRLKVPQVLAPMTVKDLIAHRSDFDTCWMAYEETAKSGDHRHLAQLMSDLQAKQRILAVFGPEGGIDPQEAKELIKAEFSPISLGPRILRAETAPAYLLSVISYHMELLNRKEENQ